MWERNFGVGVSVSLFVFVVCNGDGKFSVSDLIFVTSKACEWSVINYCCLTISLEGLSPDAGIWL